MLELPRPRFGLAMSVVTLLLVLFFARWIPHESHSILGNDSGGFLFIGQQINNGLSPFIDVWEDKPPVIYWLNALALRLTSGSPRGIVYLAGVFVLGFFIVARATLWPRIGAYPTIVALLLAVNLLPGVMIVPNTTELFSLPLQALSFLLLIREMENEPRPYYPLLQGLLAAGLFELRPNNTAVIGLYLFVSLYHYTRRRALRRLIVNLTFFLLAFVIGNIILLWPIIQGGYLRAYWDSAFLFTMRYSTRRPFVMHLHAIGVGMAFLAPFGASLMAGAGAAVVLWVRPSWEKISDRFALLALSLFALEILGSSVSGRAFEHYFIPWVLPAAALSGIFLQRCSLAIGAGTLAPAAVCGACVMLLGGSLFNSAKGIGEAVVKYKDRAASVLEYVQARSSASDRVFMWNSDGEILFRLGRRPVSRLFHYLGVDEIRVYRAQADEVLRDAERVRPTFMIEDHLREIPGLFEQAPELPEDSPQRSWDTAELKDMKTRLRNSYELVFTDRAGLRVYQRTPER